MNRDMEGERGSCSSGVIGMNQVMDPVTEREYESCSSVIAGMNMKELEEECESCSSGVAGMNLKEPEEHGSCSNGIDGNRVTEGLLAIANFYEKLCPTLEDSVQAGDGDSMQIPHDHIIEVIMGAMQSAVDVMGGHLNCQELVAMDLLCGERVDLLSLIQVATFHAYWHKFMAWTETDLVVDQAVATDECGQMALIRSMVGAKQLQLQGGPLKAGFCMSHICAIWGWIGLEETYGGTNCERDMVWMKGALHASNQLVGLRSELCLPLRYTLGDFLYTTAFHNCNGDEDKQTILFNMALSELIAYGRDVAEKSEVALEVFAVFSKAGKVAIKLQKDLSEMMELYNEVAMRARKFEQGEWERLFSLLCSGLQELENGNTIAGFKIFVEVLKCGLELFDKGDDLLSKWFDLLSHSCWWTNKSMHSLEFEHLFPSLIMPTLEEFVHASSGTCKSLLGNALFVLGQDVEGLQCLEGVHKMMADDKLNPTLHQLQKFLALSYVGRYATKNHRKAAEMYEAASKTAPDLQTQLTMDMEAAVQWVKVPEEFVQGLEKMQVVVQCALQKLPHEWEFRAFLFFEIGGALTHNSDMERGVEYLEAGWSLCAANDVAFVVQEENIYAKGIIQGLAQLICTYLHKEKLSAALALYKVVDPKLANLRYATDESKIWTVSAWRCWQQALQALYKATGSPADEVPQWEIPIDRYNCNLESMLEEDFGKGTTYLYTMADYYEDMVACKSNEGDWMGALDAYNILEEKLLNKGVLSTNAKAILHVNRAGILCQSGRELLHAEEEIQKAVDMISNVEVDPWIVTEIYMLQACIYLKCENLDAAHDSLDIAEKNLSNGKDEHWRNIMKLRSLLLQKAGQYEAASQLSCEVAHFYKVVQSELEFESAWVPFLEGTEMPKAFKVASLQYLLQKDMPKALIWAERGRCRLFMHRVNQLEAKKFDNDDQYAEDVLYKTIELCDPNTVIIVCSLLHQMVILSTLVDHPVVDKRCASTLLDLNKFFKIEANCVAGKSIEKIVINVRNHIRAGNDDKAMPGLTILHSMLVQSVLNQYHELRDCTNIIFAPEGFLHLIPFTALYDGFAEKFLIEQKAVGVIPSIRSLNNCFFLQQNLENGVKVLEDAFIAGNPEPMGLELSQLPAAAIEAQNVAEILGVEVCKSENITKEVVVKAFAKSNIVLLATHGLGKQHKYLSPYGGIVLRRANLDDNPTIEEFNNSTRDQQEVLTFDEIATMEGGISTGLVVLSTCCPLTSGNVFEEGLLSLGYVMLQAGAISAIVSLWDVSDNATQIIIVEFFKELKKGSNILQSMQMAMIKMLRGPEPNKLQHWSALTVLGSPIFQLPSYKQAVKVNLNQHQIDYYRGNQLSPNDIKENVLYPRAIVHQFQNMVWQQEDKGKWVAAIAIVDNLEERLQKNGIQVGAVAKSKFHLFRGKYMNQAKGGSWKALKELQKAIEVLPNMEEMSELVAEIFYEHAKASFRMKDQGATKLALEKAQESIGKCKDSVLLYKIKLFCSFALNEPGRFESIAMLAQEVQLKVPFVDDACLKKPLSFYEIESCEEGDVRKALMWAERDRSTINENESDAICSMLKTVNLCSPNTVIIYLSYHHHNLLLLYGFSSKASACTRLFMSSFFSYEANCVMGASLEEVVSCVHQHVIKGEDQKAISGLSILYNLLVYNILVEFKQLFAGTTEIIFAPQGFLCHIPYAALYDSSSKKFLVEQMAVGVIPSIFLLSRCFSQQEKFKNDVILKKDLKTFVSGNFELSTLGLDQLPNTCLVAKATSDIMNVEVGNKITKEALLKALATDNIVMLATDSVNRYIEKLYPYGAMVFKQDTSAIPQLLTCEDIATLEGQIKASLVVFIACHNGNQVGTLNRNGLLGLAHTALEAGAVSTIASLWDVHEDILEPLISTIFTELLQGSTILHSVQKAMKEALRSKEIRHWASLTVIGSPTLQISAPQHTLLGVVAPKSQNLNEVGNTISLNSLRKDCREHFMVPTEDRLTTLENLAQEESKILLQQLVEQYVIQIEQTEGNNDIAMEIIQCGNLSIVYGAMGKWTTCREWLVRSISTAKDNWEHVRDNKDVVCSLRHSGKFLISLFCLNGSTNMDMDLGLATFVQDMAC